MHAPQIVVRELLRTGHLERRDRAALRVEGGHHLLDRAVLAGGIDALEDDEDRTFRLGPEPVLEVGQAVELARGGGLGTGLVPAEGLAEIALGETDSRPGVDAELAAEVAHRRIVAWPPARGAVPS